jgi:ribosomal protein S27AE
MLFNVKEKCPKCGADVRLATIEPHPTKDHIAEHHFNCPKCGPVLVKVYNLRNESERRRR